MLELNCHSLWESVRKSVITSWKISPELTLLMIFSSISLVCSLSGLAIDHRYINDELAWIKPFKFSISLLLYGASLVFISSFLTGAKRLLKLSSLAALLGSVLELCAIFVQVFRGAPSHFNLATPVDEVLWYVIKIAIMPVAFAIIAMLVVLMRQKNLPPVLGSSICWGALLTVVGFIPGFLMLLPEPFQQVFTNQIMVGHTVGHTLSTATIPLIGWSAVIGDLRTAHFVGLHALQILPMLGFAFTKFLHKLSLVRQQLLVNISGYSYFALILLLTWQALKGESVVAPSINTMNLYYLLLAVSGCSIAAVLFPVKHTELGSIFAARPVVCQPEVI